MSCVASGERRLDYSIRTPSGIRLHRNDDGTAQVAGLMLEWPPAALMSLRAAIDPSTRNGICSR
jgi:hypothetical protein